jgi:hypothetical protein
MPKKSGTTISFLRKKLWRILSEYIRIKDSDKEGNIKCCTCGDLYYWKDPKGRMQAGHYIPKRYCVPLYYDEENISPQCSLCNSLGEGMQYFHAQHIISKRGEKVLERIHSDMKKYRNWKKKNPNKNFTWNRDWLNNKISHYDSLLKKEKQKRKL